jgi:hypothetical protein
VAMDRDASTFSVFIACVAFTLVIAFAAAGM